MKFFIDFEATQFSERIIDIGCVAENGNKYHTLVKPVCKKDKVNEFITKLTGITNEMLADAPTADEAFNALFDFVLAQSSDRPEYYCYGNCDGGFIDRTVSHMVDPRAVTFATALQYSLIDYSKEVKNFFKSDDNIALRKVYALIQESEVEQHHSAIEDAEMLSSVVQNMKNKCKASDKKKFANMAKVEKPTPSRQLKNAPPLFLSWPNDKWEADTMANENDWLISCSCGAYIKYFDTLDTAMMWIIRYCSKGMSIKKLDHQDLVKERIKLGINSEKRSYGFTWNINTEKGVV